MMLRLKTLFIIFAMLPALLLGDYKLSVGPEITHLKREREKGTTQHGFLYGGRARLDRIVPDAWYWGVEGDWTSGVLKGHSGNRQPLKSRFTDACIEGRFGYTFQGTTATYPSLIPFIGMGYSLERNNYIAPSPLKLHFRNTFSYIACGAFGQLYLTPRLTFGIEVTAKFCRDGKVEITHDVDAKKTMLHYEHKVNCRICIPFTYALGCPLGCAESRQFICLNPFFEYRHFGRFSQVPYNFLDTRFKIYGADLYYIYRF